MRTCLILFLKELRSLFYSPVAWVVLALVMIINGFSFRAAVAVLERGPQTGSIVTWTFSSQWFWMSYFFIFPLLTMRLFAEERRSGTIEGLLTAPVSAAAVVLGKYAATLTTFGLMWLPTVLYIVILRTTGDVDWHVVASSYVGVMGVGAGYLAVGTLMSTMTRSQLVAMMLTALVIFGLLIFGIGERIFEPGPIRDACAHVSVLSQVDELSKGIVDLRRLVFDASLVALPLFVSVRVVDSWRWG